MRSSRKFLELGGPESTGPVYLMVQNILSNLSRKCVQLGTEHLGNEKLRSHLQQR